MYWSYAAASAIGTSHLRSGTRIQDALSCFMQKTPTERTVFFSVVSDGAGSAQFGGEGASIVCRTLTTEARDYFKVFDEAPDDEVIWTWLDIARDRINLAAQRRGVTPRSFAATLVATIAMPDKTITAHVGDGAVVARRAEDSTWQMLSGPHNGEYASTTYFVTDDPQPALRIGRHQNNYNAIAAFSDGIESLVLDAATGAPSDGFFTPVARPLEASKAIGRDAKLCVSLETFLSGDRINEKTDDDKTLIIAVLK